MAGWIREPKPQHNCANEQPKTPAVSCYTTGVWRCSCHKLYVHRARWEFAWVLPILLVLGKPRWHRANLFEGARWYLAGFDTSTRLVRFSIFRLIPIWKDKIDRLRSAAWTRSVAR